MILTVPGLYNSGADHWQTHWERELPDCMRIGQKEWATPRREDWVANIEAAFGFAKPPVYFAAHSLGCIAIAYWAQTTRQHIGGALMVAPADTEHPDFPKGPRGFQPLPTRRLPFSTIVVASENDPWISFERSQQIAHRWGSRFADIGKAGHIGSADGLGSWPEGQTLLRDLMQK
jgi:predicted alpha/beta hydrolase family esterase